MRPASEGAIGNASNVSRTWFSWMGILTSLSFTAVILELEVGTNSKFSGTGNDWNPVATVINGNMLTS